MLESLNNIDINNLISTYVIPWSINIFTALAILILGRMIIKIIINLLGKILSRSKIDTILADFIKSMANAILLAFVAIAALNQLGVDTTSMVAILAAAGLAIGLSLQESLQNFAAGIMLLLFKPFKADDFVDAGGCSGSIEKINLFTTTMRTADNKEVIVPNGAIYGGNIINYSTRETRRIDMVFGISYDDDIKKAKQILEKTVNADERVLKQPEAIIAVSELGESSVNFVVRPWVKSADYWAVRFELIENIKLAFDENNISIPYPQLDLHVPAQVRLESVA
ncbi:MAG TPA: mechanosensitive ion channel domain-containing protein [Pseudomonadales bacterium]